MHKIRLILNTSHTIPAKQEFIFMFDTSCTQQNLFPLGSTTPFTTNPTMSCVLQSVTSTAHHVNVNKVWLYHCDWLIKNDFITALANCSSSHWLNCAWLHIHLTHQSSPPFIWGLLTPGAHSLVLNVSYNQCKMAASYRCFSMEKDVFCYRSFLFVLSRD